MALDVKPISKKEIKKMNSRRLIGVGLACAFVALMTGCLDKANEPVQLDPVAYVSLYNASPNAPELGVAVDDRPAFSRFAYTDYTGYLRFSIGDRNLKFGPSDAANVVLDSTLRLEEGKAYSLFVADEYQKATLVVLNDNSDKPASGKAKVRLLNLSPDSPHADLSVKGENTALIGGRAFKETSDYIEVDAKVYDFSISVEGTTTKLDVPSITLQDGGFYTILVRGYQAPPSGNTNVVSAEVIRN
jgi:hypothetical protein